MNFNFNYKKQSIFLIFIIVLASISLYFVSILAFFPNNIKLVNGIASELEFNVPLSVPFEATITPETVSVLNVNNEQVKDNITISLNDSLILETEESGRALMTLNAFGIPVKKVTIDILPDVEVVACGMAVGVRINTEGVMVLGTGSVTNDSGKSENPAKDILKSGDLLISANSQQLSSNNQLQEIVKNSEDGIIDFQVKRNDEIINAKVMSVKSDNENKIGVWVRDSTQGIGTITYYNPTTNKFAALGHGVLDIDTKKLMSVKQGQIMKSEIVSIKKGEKGSPGELVGDIDTNNILGYVKSNSPYGIYGTLDLSSVLQMPKEKMKIGLQGSVHEGPAKIRSNIEGETIEEFDIYIESINKHSADDTRGMVIRITDPKLLSKTNGIVQGMSGSPIIQDDKLIGAVTHVFVQDPTKGYGIFIENMLNYEKTVER